MNVHHKTLSLERWSAFSFAEQMANIGSEVGRAIRYRNQGETARMQAAVERALKLIDLTVNDPNNSTRRRELLRARELFCDYLLGANDYGSTDLTTTRYFDIFLPIARAGR